MDLRQLKYFVAIVDSGTLTEASHRLHIVQSALSQRLADLESSMGVQLLVRGRSGITPTPAGRELHARAKSILRHVESTRAAVREAASVASGPLGIGVLRSLAPVIGQELFRRLGAELPEVRPEIVVGYSDGLLRMLRDGALDVSLGVEQPSDSVLRGTFLFSEGVFLLGHPRHFPREGVVSLEDLQHIPLLVSSARGPVHRILDAAARSRGITLQVIGSVEDQNSLLEICATGQAATYVPESTAMHIVRRQPAMVSARIDEPVLTRRVFAYTHSDVVRSAAVVAVQRIVARLLEAHFAGGPTGPGPGVG